MQLFHFSEDPGIVRFEPRPVRVASPRAPGQAWLNGPLVWAIDDAHDFLYLFPRDCPRIVIWSTDKTTDEVRQCWLGPWRGAAYIEAGWLERVGAAVIHRYTLAPEGFEDLRDAGMWVSRRAVVPLALTSLTSLHLALASRGVELRPVESLVPLRPLWETGLHVSGIRLRHAAGWETNQVTVTGG